MVTGFGGGRFSRDENYLLLSVDNDARSEIVLLDTKTFKPLELPNLPADSNYGAILPNDSKTLAFVNSNGDTP